MKEAHGSIRGIQESIQPLFSVNFSDLRKLLDMIQTADIKVACQASLVRLDRSIHQLKDLCDGRIQDIEMIKTSVKSLLAGIVNQAGSELAKIKRHTLNQLELSIVKDMFSKIRQEAKESAERVERWIDAKSFFKEKKKIAERDDLYNEKLTSLIEESRLVRTDLKDKLDQFLEKLQTWLIDNHVKSPGQLFISYSWAESGTVEEGWLQPFLTGVKEHLDICGIVSHLDILSPDARESIFGYMRKKIEESNFILLIGTESLLKKHFSLGMVHEELSELRRMRGEEFHSGKRTGVIPVNLSKDFRLAFPAGFEGYSNIRDWPNSDYLLNLQELIGYIYDVYENQGYKSFWSDFYDHLEENNYILRRSPQDRSLPIVPGGAGKPVELEKPRYYDPHQDSDGLHLTKGMAYLPKLIPHFVKRALLIELPKKYEAGINKLILCGLGGVGKSQLATYYFYCSTTSYNFRIWFRAEENLDEQYLQFAKSESIIDENEKLSITDLRRRVHNWLTKQPSGLIVFDNVENFSDIEPFIPEPNNKLNILVTSRNRLSSEMNCMDVDVLEKSEACTLLTNVLGDAYEESQIEKLIECVGSLALALSQAAYFISHHSQSIDDYIEHYKKNLSLVLGYQDPQACPAEQHRPAWISFNLVFDKLLEKSSLAVYLLQCMSYLVSDSIQEELIFHLIKNKLPESDQAGLELLKCKKIFNEYSLVKYDKNLKLFSLHRLVQAIMREKTKNSKGDVEFLLPSSTILENLYTSLEEFGKKPKSELTELEAHHFELGLNEHSLKAVEYDPNVAVVSADVKRIDELRLGALFRIAGFYLCAGQFNLAIIYYEKAFSLQKIIGITESPSDVAMKKRGLGLAYAHAGEFEKSIGIFDEILQSSSVLEPSEVCIVLSNRALAYNSRVNKDRENVEFQEEAIEQNKRVIQAYRDTTKEEVLGISGLGHYQEIYACKLLARIYVMQKRLEEAAEVYQHVLWRIMLRYAMQELKSDKFPGLEDHCRTTLYELGSCYKEHEKPEIAHACFQRSLILLQNSPEKRLIKKCEEHIKELEPKVIGKQPFTEGILSLAKPDKDTLRRLKRNGIFFTKGTLVKQQTGERVLEIGGIKVGND